ncbi:MAG: TetR/AcrR family transcriptional regulator [Pseudomonadota bacterium]
MPDKAAAPEPDRPRGRAPSRREAVLERAAELFAARGFDGASMRDIAAAVGMLPGSLYYHFPSKEALALEIHARVVASMTERVQTALAGRTDPWDRLEAASAAHLEGLLGTGNLVAIVSPDFPEGRDDLNARLKAQRRAYEETFRALFAALPLTGDADRRLLRLQLLGALHWVPVWFRPDGGRSPAEIARAFVATIRAAHAA